MISSWIEGFAWVAPSCEDEPRGALDLSLLERSLRRGLSDLIRLFMHTAHGALSMAQRSPSEVQLVLASAFGELGTAEAILRQAFDANTASPARFRHSVHNSAPGLLSISSENRLPSTALAAGRDTVAMGLLEASMQLAEGAERVLLVFAEEHVPPFLRAEQNHGAAAAAFVLSARPTAHALARLNGPLRGEHGELRTQAQAHPLEGALRVAELCQAAASGRVVVGAGPAPYMIDVECMRSA